MPSMGVPVLPLMLKRWLCIHLSFPLECQLGFPGGSVGKESACNARNLGSIPELGRSPGEGNGNPFQSSCLENSMDRGAWQATAHGVAKSDKYFHIFFPFKTPTSTNSF